MLKNFPKEYDQLLLRYRARNLLLPVLFADAYALMASDNLENRQIMLTIWKQLKEKIGALEGGH